MLDTLRKYDILSLLGIIMKKKSNKFINWLDESKVNMFIFTQSVFWIGIVLVGSLS